MFVSIGKHAANSVEICSTYVYQIMVTSANVAFKYVTSEVWKKRFEIWRHFHWDTVY